MVITEVSMSNIPAFAHRQNIEDYAAAPTPRRTARAAPIPEMGHHGAAVASGAPDTQPPGTSRGARRTVVASMPRPDPPDRRKKADQGAIAVGFVTGRLSAESFSALSRPDDDDQADKRARARTVLDRQPDALAVMKARVLNTFREAFRPASSFNIREGAAPGLRLACRLHGLRFDLLEAANDAERLVLLADAESDLRQMLPFGHGQAAEMEREDRAGSVSLISRLLALPSPGSNSDLAIEFFDAAPVEGGN
jgi:hypothetical protein